MSGVVCSRPSVLFPTSSTIPVVFSVKSESCRNIVSDKASLNLSVVGSSLSIKVIEVGEKVGTGVGDVVVDSVVGLDVGVSVAIHLPRYRNIQEGKESN